MGSYTAGTLPSGQLHKQNLRAVAAYAELQIPMREGFYSTDLAAIRYVDLTKGPGEQINTDDFQGRIQFGNGILSTGQSPFHADRTRLTLVKWGPEPQQCGRIIFDESVVMSECSIISYREVRVAPRVMFGPSAVVMDCDGSPVDPCSPPTPDNLFMAPVLFEEMCWIGTNVTVMPGVTIGAYATVSANAVVFESVPPHSLVVGNPARVATVFS